MHPGIVLSKILVPVEFSERCHGAARYAEALACHFHSALVLLHVVPPPYSVYAGAGEVAAYSSAIDLLAEQLSHSHTEMEHFLTDLPPQICVERVILEGDPANHIVAYAHQRNVGMIVMPTHGYGPFRRFLLGSVTAKVLHDVRCPVWTGPHLEQAPPWSSIALRRIACALDLGPRSRDVLGRASALAAEFGAELLILHAIPTFTPTFGNYYFAPGWQGQLEQQASEQIAALQAELGTKGEVHIAFGDVPAIISDAARCLHADLLVIGRSQEEGVLGRLRANAYAILRESPCSVLSL